MWFIVVACAPSGLLVIISCRIRTHWYLAQLLNMPSLRVTACMSSSSWAHFFIVSVPLIWDKCINILITKQWLLYVYSWLHCVQEFDLEYNTRRPRKAYTSLDWPTYKSEDFGSHQHESHWNSNSRDWQADTADDAGSYWKFHRWAYTRRNHIVH